MNKTYPKLYNSKGRESYFEILKESDGTVVFIKHLKETGIKDRQYRSVVQDLKTKSAWDVAVTKVERKIIKMERDGWTRDKEDVGKFVLCTQLVSKDKPEKFKGKLKYPVALQRKLDGVCCLTNPKDNSLISRGKKLYDLPHISEELEGLPHLNGEIYAHGFKLQEIKKMIKRKDKRLKLHVFDFPSDDEWFSSRMLNSPNLSSKLYLDTVPITIGLCWEDVEKFHQKSLDDGYEGTVIKDLDSVYQWNGRAKDIFRYKPTYDEEFPIVSVTYDVMSNGKRGIAFICETKGRKEFKVTPAWSQKERHKAWLEDPIGSQIGQLLTCEFKGLTSDNIPNHAVGKVVRDFE